MPSRDAQRIIGVIVGALIALSVQIGGVRTDLRRMDDRLRAVEVEPIDAPIPGLLPAPTPQRNVRSRACMNAMPGTTLRLSRSSLVMKRSVPPAAAHAS